MIQTNTGEANLLLIEVPGHIAPSIESYYIDEGKLWGIYKLGPGHTIVASPLPPGQYKLLGLGPEITEEQLNELGFGYNNGPDDCATPWEDFQHRHHNMPWERTVIFKRIG